MKQLKLADVCLKTEVVDPRSKPDWRFKYVDISSVDNIQKKIVGWHDLTGDKAPSRARNLMRCGDVILATTRPNLNAVARVPEELDGQVCSTGFCVLRAGENLDRDFLFLFVRSSLLVKSLSDLVKGALYPAVSDKQVFALEIPLPDLPTQRRIAARLKEQLAAVKQARQAAEDQRRFAAAIKDRLAFEILELGDRWPRRPLEELCEIESGQVDPKLPEYSCLPHVNGENIISGKSRLFNVRTAGEDGMTSGKYLFRRGHVLYSKLRPYLRKAVLAEFDGVCSADMYPIKPFPKLLDARFLCQLLLSAPFTTYAAEKSQRARMPKINREQLLSWKAPVPDLKTQRKLSTRLSEIEDETHKLETAVENQLTALQKLPAAFLREAFGGIS